MVSFDKRHTDGEDEQLQRELFSIKCADDRSRQNQGVEVNHHVSPKALPVSFLSGHAYTFLLVHLIITDSFLFGANGPCQPVQYKEGQT